MSLTGSQLQRMTDAIRRAYTRDELRRLVRTCLEEDFDALVANKTYATQVFDLVEWADRQGRALGLLRCAHENNPGNGGLQELWAEFAPPAPPVQTPPVQTPAPPTPHDIFLSYSHHDTELARGLRAGLQADGLSVWTDDGLAPGTPNWQDAIERAVEGCRCLVVLMTPHAKASRWVRIEVDLAQELGRRVFPVLAAGEKRDAVLLSLRDVQYVDARSDYAGAIAGRLLPTLRAALGKPAVLVPPPLRTPPLDIEWIAIPAGAFLMGSDATKDPMARDIELPQHRVFLPEYHIAKYPITNAQYLQFVQAAGHRLPAYWKDGSIPSGKEKHPVVNVSWDDAVAYCRWASEMARCIIRLPSEAQWEKAARGTDGRIWPWGNQELTPERCNYAGNVWDTTPVDKYPLGASPYRVMDMAGNVWEWTSSAYKPYPYVTTDGREDVSALVRRVLRGGSYNLLAVAVRCAFRNGYSPNDWLDHLGFRVVASPSTSDR